MLSRRTRLLPQEGRDVELGDGQVALTCRIFCIAGDGTSDPTRWLMCVVRVHLLVKLRNCLVQVRVSLLCVLRKVDHMAVVICGGLMLG